MLTPHETDVKALEMIKASGILNPNATLEKITDLTQKLAVLDQEALVAQHCDTFIHRHFVYKHCD